MLNDGFVILAMMLVLPLVWWRARQAGLSRWAIIVRLAFVAWVAALVAVAFFPLPLPPYRTPEEAFGDYRGWPYPWLSPVPFETIRSSLEQGWNFPAGKYLVGNIERLTGCLHQHSVPYSDYGTETIPDQHHPVPDCLS